jgi:hypothetical protein
VIENLDHFVVEDKAFLGFLCGDEFREVLENLLYWNGDIDGLELSLLVIEDGFDAFLDLLKGDGLFMGKGL